MRVMAVDYGDVRTGIAISDPTGLIAGKAWTIIGYTPEKVAQQVAQAAKENHVEKIVLGYPKNMNGTIGPRAMKSKELSEILGSMTDAEIVLWDERRTTVDAHRILAANGRREKNRKKDIDAVAATLILEGYLGMINGSI